MAPRKIHWHAPVPESLVFSCEVREIFWNNFFTEHLWKTAPVEYLLSNLSRD